VNSSLALTRTFMRLSPATAQDYFPRMKILLPRWFHSIAITLMLASLPELQGQTVSLHSPGKNIEIRFVLTNGQPFYSVARKGREVIAPSRLGFRLKGAPHLDGAFQLVSTNGSAVDETWEQPWGEKREIRNQYRSLVVELAQDRTPAARMQIEFRAFDDGIGFRYVIPESAGRGKFSVMDELTEFALAEDYRAWWIPAFEPIRYEYVYQSSPASQLKRVNTPVTFEGREGLFVSIHEAALVNYASMGLARTTNTTLKADLFPWSDGDKVKAQGSLKTPWRTIQMADTPGGLITSYLILNLNEPNKLGDVSWVKPAKYVGVWWEMHLATKTWESGPKHGATTANTRKHIDFAARHGFSGVLVEGWNIGWDGDWMANGEKFSFTKPYPDFDLEGLAQYAKERGVYLIGHHETAVGIKNYENQMDDAYALCAQLGIKAVKSGYVSEDPNVIGWNERGERTKEWHHGQFMVEHYHRVMETAARHKVMLNVHEPVKDTGLRRTYPNMVSREGARGQEYNAWSGEWRNPPEHETILPFTRMLSGPMDFTPGIFKLQFQDIRAGNFVPTTLAKQLALYVVIYSPVQMAADLPEHYEERPEALQFIKDVPVDWEDTQVLNGKIGDYVTIVRRDRHSADWFLGSVTDEKSRTLNVELSFLQPGREYVAEIYRDGDGANFDKNPYPIVVEKRPVKRDMNLELKLAPGGGQAIRFRAVAR